jgi:hypothetical protein
MLLLRLVLVAGAGVLLIAEADSVFVFLDFVCGYISIARGRARDRRAFGIVC